MARSRQSGSAGGSGRGRQSGARGARTASSTRKPEVDASPPQDAPAGREEEAVPGSAAGPGGSGDPVTDSEAGRTAASTTPSDAASAAETASLETAPIGSGAPPPPSGPGWWLPLLAGLVGGAAVALIVLYMAPPDTRLVSRIEAVGTRLDKLESEIPDRLAAIEGSSRDLGGRLEELAGQVAALRERLTSLETLPERLDGLAGEVAGRGERLAALERRLAEIQPDLETVGALGDRLAALETRIEKLAGALPAGGQTAGPAADALRERLDALEARDRELRAALAKLEQRLTNELGGLEETLARLEADRETLLARIAALQDGLRKAREDLASTVGGLDQRLTRVAGSLRTLDDELAAFDRRLTAFGERLGELDRSTESLAERAAGLEAQLATLRSARQRAVGLVLAANSLSLATLQGGSLAQPLADIAALAGDDRKLQALVAKLEPYAESGVPTLARLRERFAALAPAMRGRATGGDSMLEKTRSNLEALVTIRRRGEALDPAAAAVDRARNALADGRLADAVAALEPLVEAGNAAAREWVELAEARLAALAAIAELDRYVRRLLVDTQSKS